MPILAVMRLLVRRAQPYRRKATPIAGRSAEAQGRSPNICGHVWRKWAVEAPGVAPFVGAVGLSYVRFQASFTPAVEVAWRLDRRYWGRGYATEAAAGIG